IHPERAQDGALGGIPDRNFFRVDARLQDGHQRGLVLADGDAVFELVLEQVAEFAGFADGASGFEILCNLSGVGTGDPSLEVATANSAPTAGAPVSVRDTAYDTSDRSLHRSAGNRG